jgi:hypothetical protein
VNFVSTATDRDTVRPASPHSQLKNPEEVS